MKLKKTKSYPINEQYFATVELWDSYVLIYIEKNTKVFFGLIDSSVRVSKPALYELGFEDRSGCDMNGVFCNRVMTLNIHERNMNTFNLQREIKTVYSAFIASKNFIETRDKKLEKIINNF